MITPRTCEPRTGKHCQSNYALQPVAAGGVGQIAGRSSACRHGCSMIGADRAAVKVAKQFMTVASHVMISVAVQAAVGGAAEWTPCVGHVGQGPCRRASSQGVYAHVRVCMCMRAKNNHSQPGSRSPPLCLDPSYASLCAYMYCCRTPAAAERQLRLRCCIKVQRGRTWTSTARTRAALELPENAPAVLTIFHAAVCNNPTSRAWGQRPW